MGLRLPGERSFGEGTIPIAQAKVQAEIVIASYRNSFFNTETMVPTSAVSSVRAGNIIGGGDWAANRIVPDCIGSLAKGEAIRIRNPSAIRPWQFVLDPLLGYLLLALRMKENPATYSGAWNFGPNYSSNITVREIAALIVSEWGEGTCEIAPPDENSVHEAGYLKLDIAKAMTVLNWRPVYTIESAIQQTVSWYKEYYTGKGAMDTFSLQQIAGFTREAEKIFVV